MRKPTLHLEVPIGSRVLIPTTYRNDGKSRAGTVIGVSSMHVIFTYIILLDEPIGECSGVAVNGPELDAEDGTNWRLPEFRPLTPEEASAAYRDAPEEDISEGFVREIVESATTRRQ